MRRLAIPVRLAVAAAEVAVARHERSDLQDSRTAHKVTVLRKMDLELLEPCCRGFFGFKIGMLCKYRSRRLAVESRPAMGGCLV